MTAQRGQQLRLGEFEELLLPFRADLDQCTIHPSAVLRADDRDSAYAGPVSDLCAAATALPGG